jgi:hypothetical protein
MEGWMKFRLKILRSLEEKIMQELYESYQDMYKDGKWPDNFTTSHNTGAILHA